MLVLLYRDWGPSGLEGGVESDPQTKIFSHQVIFIIIIIIIMLTFIMHLLLQNKNIGAVQKYK